MWGWGVEETTAGLRCNFRSQSRCTTRTRACTHAHTHPEQYACCTHVFCAADEAMARLQQGAKLRRTCATVNNAESSRSHAVFVLELAIRTPRPDGSWLEQNPRLVMMDLAGGGGWREMSSFLTCCCCWIRRCRPAGAHVRASWGCCGSRLPAWCTPPPTAAGASRLLR
jgi:hypothetical protein